MLVRILNHMEDDPKDYKNGLGYATGWKTSTMFPKGECRSSNHSYGHIHDQKSVVVAILQSQVVKKGRIDFHGPCLLPGERFVFH